MKRTFFYTTAFFSLSFVALLAAPVAKIKGKGKGKANRAVEEAILPPDSTPTASLSWHIWTASGGEKLEAKYRALENGIVTVEQKETD